MTFERRYSTIPMATLCGTQLFKSTSGDQEQPWPQGARKNAHKKGAIYQNPKQITSKSHDKWHHIPIAFHESHFLG